MDRFLDPKIFENTNTLRGMPLRPEINTYQKRDINVGTSRFLNHDIFEKNNSLRNMPSRTEIGTRKGGFTEYYMRDDMKNVGAYDNGEFTDIGSSMDKLSDGINTAIIYSNEICKLNEKIINYIYDYVKGSEFLVNGYGLYKLFMSIYLSSTKITEIELQKFFNFVDKQQVIQGINDIDKQLHNISNMFITKNFMLIGNDVPYDNNFYKKIENTIMLIISDPMMASMESKKINIIINKIMNTGSKHYVTSENLNKLQLMLLTTVNIHPIWNTRFDDYIEDIFRSVGKDKNITYLHSMNKKYGYYENQTHKLLEINCNNNDLTMGFLLNKHDINPNINHQTLKSYINNLKNCVIDEVKIPAFTADIKIRFNSCLKELGLNTLFINAYLNSLFPEGIVLQDIVQNVRIVLDNSSSDNSYNINDDMYKSNRTFIANRPFMYYFRLPKLNTLLFFGLYQ